MQDFSQRTDQFRARDGSLLFPIGFQLADDSLDDAGGDLDVFHISENGCYANIIGFTRFQSQLGCDLLAETSDSLRPVLQLRIHALQVPRQNFDHAALCLAGFSGSVDQIIFQRPNDDCG